MVALHKLTTDKPSHPWYPSQSQTTDKSSLHGGPLGEHQKQTVYKRQTSLLLSYSQSTRVQVSKTDKQASSETPQNILRDRLHKTLPLALSIPLQEVTKRQDTHTMTSKLSPCSPLGGRLHTQKMTDNLAFLGNSAQYTLGDRLPNTNKPIF